MGKTQLVLGSGCCLVLSLGLFEFGALPAPTCVTTAGGLLSQPQVTTTAAGATINWRDALTQPREWYGSDEAVRVADTVLAYQRDSGGWPKNIDMAAKLTEKQRVEIIKQKQKNDSTIDNGATYTQLAFLAKVYNARKLERHQDAFLRGVDYLLNAQYDNGGWPQFSPGATGYQKHITFNDDAMIGVMKLLDDIARNKPAYRFVDESRRRKSERVVEKGVQCILKTQVVVRGKRTVWCQQHDEVTFAPAPARTFEPVSLVSAESANIVRFLMGIKNPSQQVIEAIESAIAWLAETKITGLRWVTKPDATKPGGFDRVVVKDPTAGPIWARFYELGTNRPIFIGRDGVIKYDVAEIELERRTNYQWYVESPARLLSEDYPAWKNKLGIRSRASVFPGGVG